MFSKQATSVPNICLLLQFSQDTVVTVDAGLQVLSPNGKWNSAKRRMIDVSVYSPSGKVIFKQQRVSQDVQVSAPATETGTYKLWCVLACCTA